MLLRETADFEHVREEEEVEEERSSSVLPEATDWSVGNEERSMATLMCEAINRLNASRFGVVSKPFS